MMVVPHACCTWPPAAHEGHTTRHTDGGRRVGIIEAHPLGRQPIKMRSPYQRVAVATQVVLAVLIRHQHQDIG